MTKYGQYLYEKTYKALMKEIDELGRWRHIPCSWIGKLDVVKKLILSNLINAIPDRCDSNQNSARRCG